MREENLAPTFVTEHPVCPFNKCDMESEHLTIARGWDFEYHSTLAEIELMQCQKCEVVSPRRLPVVEALATIYPENYYAFDETKLENPIVRRFRTWAGQKKLRTYTKYLGDGPSRVMDIVCGVGRMLEILQHASSPDWSFYGLDWSEDAVQRCRAKGFDARACNIEELDQPDWEGRFDLIIMNQVIEHVRYPHDVLARILRILKPGGVVSIETPDINSWDFQVFHNRYWAGYHIPRHFFIFNKSNFSELAISIGYEVIATKSIINPVAWIHSVKSYCADHRRLERLTHTFNAQNPIWLSIATPVDLVQTAFFRKSSNMQILLRRPI